MGLWTVKFKLEISSYHYTMKYPAFRFSRWLVCLISITQLSSNNCS